MNCQTLGGAALTLQLTALQRSQVSLTNFRLTDDFYFSQDLGTTQLPFAGDNFLRIGVEHQEVSSTQVGLIVRGGTLILAIITFVLGIASTPYWDPFRNFFQGRL